jgi:hypothetical protein
MRDRNPLAAAIDSESIGRSGEQVSVQKKISKKNRRIAMEFTDMWREEAFFPSTS